MMSRNKPAPTAAEREHILRLKERFAFSYSVTDNGCWLWTKTIRAGYGRFWMNGHHVSAHRFAWEQARGPVPKGMQLNHTCHNPGCVNPAHLYVGTQTENMADMKAAGRERKALGERSGMAKLTTESVKHIRASDATTAALARQLYVSESLVRAVRQQKIWRHVRAE